MFGFLKKKETDTIMETLCRAFKESEAYARGYLEMHTQILNDPIGKTYSRTEVGDMIIKKFNEIYHELHEEES